MCARVVLVGFCRRAKCLSSSDCEVLTGFPMLLGIQMCLSKDVDAGVSRPVPFQHLASHVGDIGKMQDIVVLFKTGPFYRAWMQRWFIIRLLRRWQAM